MLASYGVYLNLENSREYIEILESHLQDIQPDRVDETTKLIQELREDIDKEKKVAAAFMFQADVLKLELDAEKVQTEILREQLSMTPGKEVDMMVAEDHLSQSVSLSQQLQTKEEDIDQIKEALKYKTYEYVSDRDRHIFV